jgi:hypothetical protein
MKRNNKSSQQLLQRPATLVAELAAQSPCFVCFGGPSSPCPKQATSARLSLVHEEEPQNRENKKTILTAANV